MADKETSVAESRGIGAAGADVAAPDVAAADSVATVGDLAAILRQLRRREARRRRGAVLTYRQLAKATGWSRGVLGGYLSGKVLAPTDRFDVLVAMLGATVDERQRLATARDRLEDLRRQAARRTATPPAGVPRQLPPAPPYFVGRGAVLARLDRTLGEPGAPASPDIVVISGIGGIGKSALALHWAHRVAHRFTDGQLHVNLRGFDPGGRPLPVEVAVRGFLDALNVPVHRIPAEADAQVALYHDLIRAKRMLLVLDNAATAEQVRALLPTGPGSIVLITSRHRASTLVRHRPLLPLVLDVLSTAEADHLLEHHLGRDRLAAEHAALRTLVDACARLPLALAVAAARAALDPHLTLAALTEQFGDGPQRLDALRCDDPIADVRAVFSWSYQQLTPPLARLFRLLGLHPGETMTVDAVASLTATPVEQVRRMLALLVQVHLLVNSGPGRFGMHDLLRLYAAELAATTDSAADLGTLRLRMIDHYLHTGHGASRVVDPGQYPLDLAAPEQGVVVTAAMDPEHAITWLAAEYGALTRIVVDADTASDDRIWRLALALSSLLDFSGHWNGWMDMLTAGLAAARRCGSGIGEIQILRRMGMAHHRAGRGDAALRHLHQARRLGDELGDAGLLARVHVGLGVTLSGLGRHQEALEHARHAYEHARTAGDLVTQANTLNGMSWCLAQLGRHQEALADSRRALARFVEAQDSYGEAETWDTMGLTYQRLGEHDQATACYRSAVALFRTVGARHAESDALDHLGDSQHTLGNVGEARSSWSAALRILTELQHPDAERLADKLRPAVDAPLTPQPRDGATA